MDKKSKWKRANRQKILQERNDKYWETKLSSVIQIYLAKVIRVAIEAKIARIATFRKISQSSHHN